MTKRVAIPRHPQEPSDLQVLALVEQWLEDTRTPHTVNDTHIVVEFADMAKLRRFIDWIDLHRRRAH